MANIADDLIIHGNGVEEHDKRLFAVLDRLRQVGLTLNSNKCEFRLSKLTFSGHELTSDVSTRAMKRLQLSETRELRKKPVRSGLSWV